MNDEAHVIPRDDAVVHNPSDDCCCGPRCEPVQRADGSTGWLYIHHSLDGREQLDELSQRRESKRIERDVELHQSRHVKPFDRPDGCVCFYPTRGYHADFCNLT